MFPVQIILPVTRVMLTRLKFSSFSVAVPGILQEYQDLAHFVMEQFVSLANSNPEKCSEYLFTMDNNTKGYVRHFVNFKHQFVGVNIGCLLSLDNTAQWHARNTGLTPTARALSRRSFSKAPRQYITWHRITSRKQISLTPPLLDPPPPWGNMSRVLV